MKARRATATQFATTTPSGSPRPVVVTYEPTHRRALLSIGLLLCFAGLWIGVSIEAHATSASVVTVPVLLAVPMVLRMHGRLHRPRGALAVYWALGTVLTLFALNVYSPGRPTFEERSLAAAILVRASVVTYR